MLEKRKKLTESQAKCLEEIKKFVDDHGVDRYPTLHELAAIIGVSHAAIFQTKKILKEKKYLNKYGEIIK